MLGKVGKRIVGTGIGFVAGGFLLNEYAKGVVRDPDCFIQIIKYRLHSRQLGAGEFGSPIEKRMDVFTRVDCSLGNPSEEERKACLAYSQTFGVMIKQDLERGSNARAKSGDSEKNKQFQQLEIKFHKKYISILSELASLQSGNTAADPAKKNK